MYERKVSKDNELPLEVLLEVQIHTVTRVDSFLHLHAHFTNQNFLCNSVYEKKKCCITRILSSVDSPELAQKTLPVENRKWSPMK